MLLDSKTYTNINTGLINMRLNVIAIRKTLIRNKTAGKQVDTKIKLQNDQLAETKKRAEVEKERERNRNISISMPKLSLVKPEGAFSILSSNPVSAVVSFFSFALIGWMLKALPSFVLSVQSFITRAKLFLKSLTEFWGKIRNFFQGMLLGIKKIYTRLIQGVDFFVPGAEKTVEDAFSKMARSLRDFITAFPTRVYNFIGDLIGLNKDVYNKVKSGQSVEEAMSDVIQLNLPPPIGSPRRQKTLSPEQERLLQEIPNRYGSGYDVYLARSKALNKKITELNLGQVLEKLKSGQIRAAGEYRIDTNSLEDALNSRSFSRNQKFDQDTQNRLFNWIIFNNDDIKDYLNKRISNNSKEEELLTQRAAVALTSELPDLLSARPGETFDENLRYIESYLSRKRKLYQDYLKGVYGNRSSTSTSSLSESIASSNVPDFSMLNTGPRKRVVNISTEIPISNELAKSLVNRSFGGMSSSEVYITKHYSLNGDPYRRELFS